LPTFSSYGSLETFLARSSAAIESRLCNILLSASAPEATGAELTATLILFTDALIMRSEINKQPT